MKIKKKLPFQTETFVVNAVKQKQGNATVQ